MIGGTIHVGGNQLDPRYSFCLDDSQRFIKTFCLGVATGMAIAGVLLLGLAVVIVFVV
jgi:hypothetical protein